MSRRLTAVACAVLVAATVLAGSSTASGRGPADVPPNPLLWQRQYVTEYTQSDDEVRNEIIAECPFDLDRGLRENGSGGPRLAVLGDSVQSQMRYSAMGDEQIRWMYGSHCGEKFSTAIDSGRVSDAVASDPAALVIGLGGNDLSEFWQVRIDYLPAARYNLQRILDATDSLSCRVMFTLPEQAPWFAQTWEHQLQWLYMTQQINADIRSAASSRPGLRVADWAQRIAIYPPAYLQDGMHLTRKGINEKMNLAIETARGCWPPDTPPNVGAVAGNGTATVWWDPIPPAEQVMVYRVTASPGGQTVNTTNPTVNVPGLTNGQPYQFTVEAWSFAGISTPSAPSNLVTPSAVGARFRATQPTRILDTRFNVGGKNTPFGPGESFTLALGASVPSGSSGVVLNVTATGQTESTFITVWPGGQSKPLTSNLNPRPGVNAVPAMATTRIGPGGTVQLFNNSGTVHLIADVVGYYDAPGTPGGALYGALEPLRVLDTRTGEGGKSAPFGSAETFILDLSTLPTGASAAVLNVTATETTNGSHITVWPADAVDQPTASMLNPQPGLTRANLTTVKVSSDEKVKIFNNSAQTSLIVDLVGFYTALGAATGGSEYFPLTPERVYDTRFSINGVTGPINNGANLQLGFAGKGALPATNVSAIDANVTVVSPSALGHTTVWPSGAKPNASILNYLTNEVVANRNNITLSSGNALFWSAAPNIHYIVDTAGWFGPTL